MGFFLHNGQPVHTSFLTMSTETASLSREETISGLRQVIHSCDFEEGFWPFEACTSAIAHLTPSLCTCEDFSEAVRQNFIWFHEIDGYKVGIEIDPISLCPWCGGSLPTAEPGQGS